MTVEVLETSVFAGVNAVFARSYTLWISMWIMLKPINREGLRRRGKKGFD